MKHTFTPREKMTTDDMSMEELVRPISAKVLPRSALVLASGHVVSEDFARSEAARKHRLPNSRGRKRG